MHRLNRTSRATWLLGQPVMRNKMADSKLDEATITQLTGSVYKGPVKNGRMEGKCEYVFTSGTKYIGDMLDGMFHGQGVLYFPNGGQFEAEWHRGSATGGCYTFNDGLAYTENNWEYCTDADRRFNSEICNGIRPAGRTQLTDKQALPDVPLGWYDCGDGLYNPQNRVVYKYDSGFLRNADIDEHEWIVKNCRKGVTPEEQL